MDFEEKVFGLAKRVEAYGDKLENEEMTKTALVLPFIQTLGYDAFNPAEVVPEFSAPIGERKDARVDYAILSEGKPIIIIECKPLGTPLDFRHCGQLQLYFHGTEASIAVLTDGNRYLFFSDLESPNRMDTRPFMDFRLDAMERALIPELRKLAKGRFDYGVCRAAASGLKYNREFKRVMAAQLEKPDEKFIRFFVSKIHDGEKLCRHRNFAEKFGPMLADALNQFVNERIDERLENAMTKREEPVEESAKEDGVVTTSEEIEAFHLVRFLLMGTVEPERVVMRDCLNFCNILLDGNHIRPLFRLHFNKRPWRVGFFDGQNKDEKVEIVKVEDIAGFADRIRATVAKYDKKG